MPGHLLQTTSTTAPFVKNPCTVPFVKPLHPSFRKNSYAAPFVKAPTPLLSQTGIKARGKVTLLSSIN